MNFKKLFSRKSNEDSSSITNEDAKLLGYKDGVNPFYDKTSGSIELVTQHDDDDELLLSYLEGYLQGIEDFDDIETHVEYCVKNNYNTEHYIECVMISLSGGNAIGGTA